MTRLKAGMPDRGREQEIVSSYRRGRSVEDIRKVYNISPGLIYKILERNGIALQEREPDRTTAGLVMNAYRDGKTPAKIRKEFGLSAVQLRGIIKRKS